MTYTVKARETLKKHQLLRRLVSKLNRTLVEDPRRARIRAEVLGLPPVGESADNSYSTHMLVCSRDVEMAVCTAKVADLAFGTQQNWVFHDDGSLTELEVRALQNQLPSCVVVTREEADMRAEEELREFPKILDYRRNQVMAL
ncbi:MAG: hypothetical protein KJO98_07355, partial [Rhodothermia bacterium]|nr:hypothetical protein [Rhodothermia bacterium]